MPLTDAAIKSAKAKSETTPTKHYDKDGLFLLVHHDGRKYWRFRYRIPGLNKAGKPVGIEKNLALGVYPEVSLKEARERAARARLDRSAGIDPISKKKALKVAGIAAAKPSTENTFEPIAREWHAQWAPNINKSHAHKVLRRLENYLIPTLGKKQIDKITGGDLMRAIKTAEKGTSKLEGGPETAHRVLTIYSQVVSYAVIEEYVGALRDITRDVRRQLRKPKPKHMAAIIKPTQIGELLRASDSYRGTNPVVTKIALQLAPYVFVRPGELRQAEWTEFDLDHAMWVIPAARMKGRPEEKEEHHVPLARQAVKLLRELHKYTGRGKYLFPSVKSSKRPMSDGTIIAALRTMGFDGKTMSAHGYRAMARTNLDQALKEPVPQIELQLAHAVEDANGKAYNRTDFLPERKAMMQRWADWLDEVAVAG